MVNERNESDLRPLLSRWTMLLAHRLQEDNNWGAHRSMVQAHRTRRLLDALGRGIAWFTYRKEDGDVRIAMGTLRWGVSVAFDSYVAHGGSKHRDNSNTDGVYTYWDLDATGFRSFRAENLISIDKTFTV